MENVNSDLPPNASGILSMLYLRVEKYKGFWTGNCASKAHGKTYQKWPSFKKESDFTKHANLQINRFVNRKGNFLLFRVNQFSRFQANIDPIEP